MYMLRRISSSAMNNPLDPSYVTDIFPFFVH